MMNLNWILLIVVVLIGLQATIIRRYGLRKLKYERYFDRVECFEGEHAALIERISNNKLLPVPWVRLESRIPAALVFEQQHDLDINAGERYQNHKSFFSMLPYMQITRRHKVLCSRRGYYPLTSASLTYGDFIGVNRQSRTLDLDLHMLVYPRPIALADIPYPSHSWQGDISVRRWIVDDPFLNAGIRQYRSGDPLNRINWKATARTQQFQVNQPDFTADHRLMILVNFEVSADMWRAVIDPERIELGLRYAATLADQGVLQGMEVGFACNGYLKYDTTKEAIVIDPDFGKEHYRQILKAMAMAVIERAIPFDYLLAAQVEQQRERTDYVIISAFISEEIEEQMDELRRQGHAVVHVPLELPPSLHQQEEKEAEADDPSEKAG